MAREIFQLDEYSGKILTTCDVVINYDGSVTVEMALDGQCMFFYKMDKNEIDGLIAHLMRAKSKTNG